MLIPGMGISDSQLRHFASLSSVQEAGQQCPHSKELMTTAFQAILQTLRVSGSQQPEFKLLKGQMTVTAACI